MNANEILKAARELISKPENWLVGVRNNGQGAYCALGALDKFEEYTDARTKADETLSRIVEDHLPFDPCNGHQPPTIEDARNYDYLHQARVAGYNNTHSHECVLRWFDRAIEQTAPK